MILEIIIWFILINLSLFTVVSIYNFITVEDFSGKLPLPPNDKFISVLIPARNEEANLSIIINTLIRQTFRKLEIIILDDESTDKTLKIAKHFAKRYHFIKVIKGKPLPEGWLGKNWACFQLANSAKGDYLLFVDADVVLEKEAITNTLSLVINNDLNALSVFPTQVMKSIGEYLIVPLMNWLLLTFLPLRKVYRSPNKSFVAANGQYFFFEKESYLKIGGHEAVKEEFVEDMELARILKSKKMKIMTCLGGGKVKCKMYDTFFEGLNGFAKNFYRGFKIPWILFIIMIAYFGIIFLLPFILIPYSDTLLFGMGLIIIQRFSLSYISKQNILINILLFPIQMIILLFMGFYSLFITEYGVLKWKGRKIN